MFTAEIHVCFARTYIYSDRSPFSCYLPIPNTVQVTLYHIKLTLAIGKKILAVINAFNQRAKSR